MISPKKVTIATVLAIIDVTKGVLCKMQTNGNEIKLIENPEQMAGDMLHEISLASVQKQLTAQNGVQQ